MPTEIKFQDRSARVILVDSSGAVRQLLSEVAKSVGFLNAQAVASITDAHNILETESVDWVIVPLALGQEVNGLHTLRMTTSFYELRNTRVSFLLEESEMWCLAKSFELGLLSYHTKPFTKDSLSKDLEDFLRMFESHGWNGTKLSAEYLRRHLKATNSGADLSAVEKTLLDLYPGDATQLLNLAHAQHLNGQTDAAKITLKQATFIDASLAPKIEAKSQELFGSTDLTPSAETAGAGNVLGLESVVIVDPDDTTRAASKAIFEELGVTNIQDFSDGEAAWNAIDSGNEPSLIIMDWRLPSLTGPLFMQRVRGKGYMRVPMVVHSALITPADMPIIKEMGVANLVQKPAEKEAFIKAVVWTVQQDRMPTEQQTLETKIRGMLGIKNITEAESIAARYLADETIASGRKNVIRAEIAFAKDQFEAARDFAIESIKSGTESIFALNVLGKSLMVLREFDAALKCFQKAQSLSPINLERLVMIAESQAEIKEVEAANETVAQAKDIDPDSATVQEGEAKVAIASGAPDAKKMMGKIEAIGNVISYLNNKAVAHAKCGLNEDGIELYRKTLDAVPEDKIEIRAIVTYNMAIAKIRKNDLTDAMMDLDVIIAMKESKVAKKAQSLKERLETSMTKNTPFTLREGDHGTGGNSLNPASPTQDESKTADGTTVATAIVQTTAGDQCCYLVFKTSAAETPDLQKLMATPPKYKARKAIELADKFGSNDTTNKAS